MAGKWGMLQVELELETACVGVAWCLTYTRFSVKVDHGFFPTLLATFNLWSVPPSFNTCVAHLNHSNLKGEEEVELEQPHLVLPLG